MILSAGAVFVRWVTGHSSVLATIWSWLDKLDHVINTQDGNSSFSGELEGLNLGESWLEDTGIPVVSGLSIEKVKTTVDHSLLLLISIWSLGSVVEYSQSSDKIGGIFSGVHGQDLWNHQQSLREFSNGQLLTGSESSSVVIKEDREGNFDGTTSGNERLGLEDSLDNTEGVMD